VPDRRSGFDQGPYRRSGRRRSRWYMSVSGLVPPYSRAASTISSTTTGSRRPGRSWSCACCSRRSPGAKRSPPSHRRRRRCPPVHRPAHRAIDRRTELESRAVLDASALRLVRVDRAAQGLFGFPTTLLKYHVIEPSSPTADADHRWSATGAGAVVGSPGPEGSAVGGESGESSWCGPAHVVSPAELLEGLRG
jgi:hypothetical protein